MRDLVPTEIIRPPILEIIETSAPKRIRTGYICNHDLNKFRVLYVKQSLEAELGEISVLENEVLRSLQEQDLISANVYARFDSSVKTSEEIADKVAGFGGSWRFIILFGSIIALWIGINSAVIFLRPFDPYPYILLNLVLSCLAALQAPFIMMSQKRVEDRDRFRSDHDYKVDLKAELEIRLMQEKMDYLLHHQWGRLMEIQEIQLEIMRELAEHKRP